MPCDLLWTPGRDLLPQLVRDFYGSSTVFGSVLAGFSMRLLPIVRTAPYLIFPRYPAGEAAGRLTSAAILHREFPASTGDIEAMPPLVARLGRSDSCGAQGVGSQDQRVRAWRRKPVSQSRRVMAHIVWEFLSRGS
jgi:hypothetical protein